jgi:hypothetical protein
MRTTLKTVLTISMVILFTACNNNQQKEGVHEGHDHGKKAQVKASASATADTTTVKIKDDNLDAIYQQYQHLTAALTDGNSSDAKVAAIAIEAGAKEIQGGSALTASAAQITDAMDIEVQRTMYAALSDEFIALLKQTGFDSGQLYVAHCPMALNNEGARWVSKSEEIQNPYYGESMLTCGSVIETLK